MRVLVEASAFLTIAAVAHLAIWSPEAETGEESAGAGGESLLTINPSSASIQRMVETWDRPPETLEVVETAMQAPDVPQIETPAPTPPQDAPPKSAALIELPKMGQSPDAPPMPVVNPAPPPKPEPKPEPEPKKVEAPKPKPKPKAPQKASKEAAQVAAKRAKGSGGSARVTSTRPTWRGSCSAR